jgi:N-acetylglucosamine repressor
MKHVTTKTERDKRVIRAVVLRYGPLSRVEIHELTNLRQSTISALVRELLEEGSLLEAGRSDNPVGRKQILLRLNDEHGFIAGVEFDDELVIGAVLDLSAKIRSVVKERTVLDGGIEGLTRQLLFCVRKAISEAGIAVHSLIGVGIADPGLVNTEDGISYSSSTIEFWKQVPLRSVFEEQLGVPTVVESDTRARAVAERILGVGEMAEDMIYVDYGTGIGAGIILDGKLLRGHRWAAGEFGHTHVTENGPACRCGSFGCLEAVAGAAAVQSRIRQALAEGSSSQAQTLAGGDVHKISVWTVMQAARLGDKICTAIVQQVGNCLGLGIADLVNLFNPSLIVLDKRLGLAGQALLDQVVRIVKRKALNHSTEDLVIRFGTMGEEAGVLGMGLLLIDRYFEIPALKLPRFMTESILMSPQRKGTTAAASPNIK